LHAQISYECKLNQNLYEKSDQRFYVCSMRDYKKIIKLEVKELIEIYQSDLHVDKDNAFYALVDRFKSDLTLICEKRCNVFQQSSDVVYELVNNVFKAYARKPQFDFDKAKVDNDYNAFLVYLCAIAKTELTNIYRIQQKKKNGTWYDGSEYIITELPILSSNNSVRGKLIYQLLTGLPYSHQVIYCTYTSYEKNGCNLPRKLQKELREHLGIRSQATIRSYKKETLDMIKVALMSLSLSEKEIDL
jgi:hypothetical protein